MLLSETMQLMRQLARLLEDIAVMQQRAGPSEKTVWQQRGGCKDSAVLLSVLITDTHCLDHCG